MAFIKTPSGNVFSHYRIGGVKAPEGYFIILGNGADEIVEFLEVPIEVALLWRDELVELLTTLRPNRAVRQLDWMALAATVDVAWATENGWTAPTLKAAE